MQPIYTQKDDKLIIHEPYNELWSMMRCRGKYISPVKTKNCKLSTDKLIFKGKLTDNNKFYFDSVGTEIQLSVDYDYDIKWKVKNIKCNKIKVGFYSPYRKFSSDRLYLNVDKNTNNLTIFEHHKGEILINCNILVIATNKHYDDLIIKLKITPKLKIKHNTNLKIFDIIQEGIFSRSIIKDDFKKLYYLVRKYYELTSIIRDKSSHYSNNLPKEIEYKNLLAKNSYESIFTVTTKIEPSSDRIGSYGIIVKREQGLVSSATINYEIILSHNILKTPDIIVMAAYYEGDRGYVLHQIYDKKLSKDVYVMNTHTGPYPYDHKGDNISGSLKLESTAIDITLIISNSLYGILPINGQDPNTIVKFVKFDIQYDDVER